jgi:hypothetical protein
MHRDELDLLLAQFRHVDPRVAGLCGSFYLMDGEVTFTLKALEREGPSIIAEASMLPTMQKAAEEVMRGLGRVPQHKQNDTTPGE